jgi:hypothetical protein
MRHKQRIIRTQDLVPGSGSASILSNLIHFSKHTGLVLLSTTKLALHHYKWNLCENVAKSSKMEFCQITKVGFLQIGVYSIDSIYVIWCDVDN